MSLPTLDNNSGPDRPISREFAVGDTIPENYVVREIRRGGMGVVYICYNSDLQAYFAIKSVANADGLLLRRLHEEARSWIRLPRFVHVVQAFVVKRIDRRLHIIMEYVDGPSLAEFLQEGTRPIPELVRIAAQIAAAIAHVHSVGLVHRDVKPANVLMTKNCIAKLTDFGLADGPQRSADGVCGTPTHMAPEQWTGNAFPQSDLYACGVVLHEMFFGIHPFPYARTIEQLRAAHIREIPLAPRVGSKTVPQAVEQLVLQCLAKDPRNRPASANSVQQVLQDTYQDISGYAMPVAESETGMPSTTDAILRGMSLAALDDHAGALTQLETAMADERRLPLALRLMAESLSALGRHADAITLLEEAVAAAPSDHIAWNNLSAASNAAGAYRRGLESARRSIELSPDYGLPWNNAGVSLNGLDRRREAVAALQKAVLLDPGSPQAWSNLGYVLSQGDDMDAAASAFETAIELDAHFARPYFNYAMLLCGRGDVDGALAIVRQLLQLHPHHVEAHRIERELRRLSNTDGGSLATHESFRKEFD